MTIGEDITESIAGMTAVAIDILGREYVENETEEPIRIIAFDMVRDEVHDLTILPGGYARIPRPFRVLASPNSSKCARCLFVDGVGAQ